MLITTMRKKTDLIGFKTTKYTQSEQSDSFFS